MARAAGSCKRQLQRWSFRSKNPYSEWFLDLETLLFGDLDPLADISRLERFPMSFDLHSPRPPEGSKK